MTKICCMIYDAMKTQTTDDLEGTMPNDKKRFEGNPTLRIRKSYPHNSKPTNIKGVRLCSDGTYFAVVVIQGVFWGVEGFRTKQEASAARKKPGKKWWRDLVPAPSQQRGMTPGSQLAKIAGRYGISALRKGRGLKSMAYRNGPKRMRKSLTENQLKATAKQSLDRFTTSNVPILGTTNSQIICSCPSAITAGT